MCHVSPNDEENKSLENLHTPVMHDCRGFSAGKKTQIEVNYTRFETVMDNHFRFETVLDDHQENAHVCSGVGLRFCKQPIYIKQMLVRRKDSIAWRCSCTEKAEYFRRTLDNNTAIKAMLSARERRKPFSPALGWNARCCGRKSWKSARSSCGSCARRT